MSTRNVAVTTGPPRQSQLVDRGDAGFWHGFKPFKAAMGGYVWQGNGPGNSDALIVSNWVKTEVGTNTEVTTDGAPPYLLLTTGANIGDGHNLQWSKDGGTTVFEAFKIDANRPIWVEFEAYFGSATQAKGEIGLAITDTEINGGVTDGIYIRFKASDATPFVVLEKNSTETEIEASSTYDRAATTRQWYGLRITPTSVQLWGNYGRTLIASHTVYTNIPDDEELALSVNLVAAAASAATTRLYHVAAYQERDVY